MTEHEHDLGLRHDLATLSRRGLIGLGAGLGVVLVSGCSADEVAPPVARNPSPGAAGGAASGAEPLPTGLQSLIPTEMAGPFPADGTNGPNLLNRAGVVRPDLTRSFGKASGVAPGVPLTLRMRMLRLRDGEASARPDVAVYAWHCARAGDYSMYDGPLLHENHLRGVQSADTDGWVEFQTIFPGCYPGRWPHVHFEVYLDLEEAAEGGPRLRTSQLAFPEEACREAYRTPGYEVSRKNLQGITLASDLIFGEGWSLQLAEMTGSNKEGWVATLNVPV